MKTKKINNLKHLLVFVGIFFIAAFSRFYGNNWDQGQHLHPDERFLTMVATSLQWPKSIREYFATSTSPLNPHNRGHNFYVYGIWPVLLVKAVAQAFHKDNYENLVLVGRTLSGLTDMITLFFVFLIGKRLGEHYKTKNSEDGSHSTFYILHSSFMSGLLSMAIYSMMVLPIQLSHFYTVDPYVTMMLTIFLFLLTFPPTFLIGILSGIVFALALAAKVSAAPIIILLMPYLFFAFKKSKNVTQIIIFILFFGLISFCVFRTFMPYLFTDYSLVSINPRVFANWQELKGFNNPKAWFPPGIQWINTPKIIYPLLHIIFVGLGLPLAILCGISFVWTLTQIKKNLLVLGPWFLVLSFFVYQGLQYSLPTRYFWPIYPSLAILTGLFITSVTIKQWNNAKKKSFYILHFTFFILLLIWPVSFMSIYSRPHSRVIVSQWIYQNIPPGSSISFEHWDDPLPLNFPEHPNSQYVGVELPMYAPDNNEKWREIDGKLATLDYLILSSNRVYGSITSAPERYPKTAQFYQDLFSGKRGFVPIAQFSSHPTLPIPLNLCITVPFSYYGKIDSHLAIQPPSHCSGIEFIDDYSDETFTVYDHPKVTIFKRK